MGTGDLCRVSPAVACHGRARESSGTGPCGDCRRAMWLPNPRSQCSGKIRFIEKPGYKTMGVVMWLNVVLTPRSLPRSQSSGTGPSSSCVYCCPLCPTGCRYPGKISFIEPQCVNGHKRPMPGAPRSGTPRERQAKFRDGTVWGL